MAVFRLHGYNADGNGTVIISATVNVYLAGGTTTITCYDTFGATGAVTGSELTTDSSGNWECFVKDSDHASGTQFKTVSTKAGYITKTEDYLTWY